MLRGEQLTIWVTGLVGKAPIFDSFMRLVVNDYFIPVCMGLIVLGLWFGARSPAQRDRNQRAVMHAAVGVGFANLWVELTKLHYFWPRPFVDLASAARAVDLIFYGPPDPSFPSNPAAVGFAAATAVWFANRRVAAVLYFLAILWSFSRVYAGVSYPIGILAGALLGAATSIIVAKAFLPLFEPLPTWFLKLGRWFHIA